MKPCLYDFFAIKKFNVFIKPHPMYPISDTYDQNNQIKITNQNLSELLKKTDTLWRYSSSW